MGFKVLSGDNAHILMKTPNNLSSWEFFDKLLNEAYVVGTPGLALGCREKDFRLSSFGDRQILKSALKSIEKI